MNDPYGIYSNLGLNDTYNDQYGIPVGSNDYNVLQAKIARMEKLVTALNDFHDQTHSLDTNHQNQVIAFRDAVMQLYNANPPFQGKAADNLFNLLLSYLQSDQSFTGQQGDTSPQLTTATTYAKNTATSIDQKLQDLYKTSDQYAYTLDKDRNVPAWLRPGARLFDLSFPSDAALDANCVLPPETIRSVENMQEDEYNWGNQMTTLATQAPPSLPADPTDPTQFTLPPSQFMDALSNDQLDLARRLANEYGLDEEDIIRLLEYDPTLTEADLRKLIADYLQKKQQYPSLSASQLLLALAMNLPDSVLSYMTHLNDGTTNQYQKGNPGDNIYADILAATLGQLTQETKAQISSLQSAIQKARNKKGSNLTEQEIMNAVNSTGTQWSSLPKELQDFLLGKSKIPYKYAYGLIIEHMVMDTFQADYPAVYQYYTNAFGLKYRQGFPGSNVMPDIQFTADGQTVIEDITSQQYMPTKQKYQSLPDILIALGY